MQKHKKKGIEALKRRYGMCFVAPWVFGVILFFLIPLITSIAYSFSEVVFNADGLSNTLIGFKNYKKILFEDPNYIDDLVESISGIFTSLPIIVALSLIFALILNQKFKGRTLMRAIFFLPVIVASGAVTACMWRAGGDGGFMTNVSETGSSASSLMGAINFDDIFDRLNLPSQMSDLISEYLSDVFGLIWNCGVQTILFIAGLQTIPEHLYEEGRIEGATIWETFWYITVPMLGQVILLVIFYTMIELFISQGTLVESALNSMTQKNIMDVSSAQLWLYFTVVLAVMGIVILLYKKLALERWE